jgi:hypothetical protein
MQRFSLRGEASSLLVVPTAGCTSTLSEPSLRSSTQLSGYRVNQDLVGYSMDKPCFTQELWA